LIDRRFQIFEEVDEARWVATECHLKRISVTAHQYPPKCAAANRTIKES